MFLLASAADLVMLLVALETVSLLSYVLVGFLKGDRRSSEAGLKYAIYGAFASGIFFFGLSLIFGITGETSFAGIASFMEGGPPSPLLTAGALFVFAGLGFKVASFPFHFWCPDVYEGAPIPVTAFLSVGPKAAGFAAMTRFFLTALSKKTGIDEEGFAALHGMEWPEILLVISAITMTIGNLSAIPQNNLKRFLAYSSIAHAGYILMGLGILTADGVRGMALYLALYLFMNMGAFAAVAAVGARIGSEEIPDFRGLGTRAPFVGVALTVFLFSLTGLPPLSGFVAKFYLFGVALKAGFLWIVIVAVLNSVVSLYYYARVVKVMFLEKGPDTPVSVPLSLLIAIILCLVPTILFGIYWSPLVPLLPSSP